MSQKLSLGFSPCPNDTFIFDALIHKKLNDNPFDFSVSMEDVEWLNNQALNCKLDITKLSYFAYAFCSKDYQLLTSGSALGKGCGPLLVTLNNPESINLKTASIAIPGKYTTANFLLSIFAPDAKNKSEILFSEIEDKVINGEFDAGLLIHENRFTYKEKGLKLIADLGEFWERTTGNLIPLGGIAIKRSLPEAIKLKINDLIKQSIEYAYENIADVMPFIKAHAQELEEEVMQKHIDLYVNKYSLDLEDEGKNAVEKMYNLAVNKGIIPNIHQPIFVK